MRDLHLQSALPGGDALRVTLRASVPVASSAQAKDFSPGIQPHRAELSPC
jgi:hypothetical protein